MIARRHRIGMTIATGALEMMLLASCGVSGSEPPTEQDVLEALQQWRLEGDAKRFAETQWKTDLSYFIDFGAPHIKNRFKRDDGVYVVDLTYTITMKNNLRARRPLAFNTAHAFLTSGVFHYMEKNYCGYVDRILNAGETDNEDDKLIVMRTERGWRLSSESYGSRMVAC